MEDDLRRGRPPKYPWDEWFRQLAEPGASIRLKRGVDFGIDLEYMRRSVLTEAKRRGMHVKTTAQMRGQYLRVDRVSRSRQRSRQRYRWSEWLDGTKTMLAPGSDFTVDVETMRRMARRQAHNRGLGFRSTVLRGALWIQALPADTNALESDDR